MPQMGGRQLAERIVLLRPQTKVLYLSGHTEDAVIRHGIEKEQTAFLEKPFTPQQLIEKVLEVLHG
jgi:CheY-like chemotaxis protein